MEYDDFLREKLIRERPCGVDAHSVCDGLFDWQKAVTKTALACGRYAMFEDCGLGKTAQQLAWAKEISAQGPVLICAPLAVSAQTKREGAKFGIPVNICESENDLVRGVNITNYEKLAHFSGHGLAGVVLDESSILKSYMGKTKRQIVELFRDVPYRLAATATPAPNDLMELLNHAEFLGIMRSSEALSVWFIADQSQSGVYRLKGHAEADFWQWVSSWACCIEKPSDIGYADDGYVLPPLMETDEIVHVDDVSDDWTHGFFRDVDMSATGFFREKSRTVEARAEKCAEFAAECGQHLVWCETNEEADALRRRIPDAVEIRGSDRTEVKEQAALDFVDGKTRVLISKPSIFGFGLNFQQCHDAIFCGLDYSFEKYYQAVRRLWRFGQNSPVTVRRVIGSTEKNILDVLARKQESRKQMQRGMSDHMKNYQTENIRGTGFHLSFEKQNANVPDWLRSETA